MAAEEWVEDADEVVEDADEVAAAVLVAVVVVGAQVEVAAAGS